LNEQTFYCYFTQFFKLNIASDFNGSVIVSLSSTGFALLGAILIAISFGIARFAFGLYVPPIRDALALSSVEIGFIAALPLVSFLIASALAPWLTDRLGARLTAVTASAFAVLGLALISFASSPLPLAAGVFACGLCTGLMMPALTAAMQVLVRRSLQGRVSAVLNAGTSLGIMVAVPTVLLLTDAWRVTYLAFAALALLGGLAAWLLLPSVSRILPANAVAPVALPELPWSRLIRLAFFCFTTGFISSAFWIFAPDLVITLGNYPAQASALLWLGVGLAGLGGAVIADLADRNNPPITQALMIMILAASMALLAASPNQIVLTTFSALMFGLA
jgi:predicted MFS family arabinose efflux permease